MDNWDKKLDYIIWRDRACWASGRSMLPGYIIERPTFAHIWPKDRAAKTNKIWRENYGNFGDSVLNGHCVYASEIGKNEGNRWTFYEALNIEHAIKENDYYIELLNFNINDSIDYDLIRNAEIEVAHNAGISPVRIYEVLYMHPVLKYKHPVRYQRLLGIVKGIVESFYIFGNKEA